MNNYLVSYDISEDRLRTKVAKLLERRGCKRLQKSVFFAPGYSLKEMRTLRADLVQMLKSSRAPADSLLCVPVNKDAVPKMRWDGDPERFEAAVTKPLSTML